MPRAAAGTSRAFRPTPASSSTSLNRPTWIRSTGLPPTVSIDQIHRRGRAAEHGRHYHGNSRLPPPAFRQDRIASLVPACGQPIRRQAPEQIVNSVLAMDEGRKVMVLAPLVRNRKGMHPEAFATIRRDGPAQGQGGRRGHRGRRPAAQAGEDEEAFDRGRGRPPGRSRRHPPQAGRERRSRPEAGGRHDLLVGAGRIGRLAKSSPQHSIRLPRLRRGVGGDRAANLQLQQSQGGLPGVRRDGDPSGFRRGPRDPRSLETARRWRGRRGRVRRPDSPICRRS